MLHHFSKAFEQILCKYIDIFMEKKFPPYLCRFRKNRNAQYSLLKMIENWKKKMMVKKIGVIFMDLSKGWHEVITGVSQGFTVDTLLFNILTYYSLKCQLCSFDDKNTLCK